MIHDLLRSWYMIHSIHDTWFDPFMIHDSTHSWYMTDSIHPHASFCSCSWIVFFRRRTSVSIVQHRFHNRGVYQLRVLRRCFRKEARSTFDKQQKSRGQPRPVGTCCKPPMPTPLTSVSWQPSFVPDKFCCGCFLTSRKNCWLSFPKISIAKIHENFQTALFVPPKNKEEWWGAFPKLK